MSYSEPPEWHGRGARSREGWPNGTYNEDVRSHRRGQTGEFERADPPTDPRLRPVLRPQFRLEPPEPDALTRFALWLQILRDVLAIVLIAAALWIAGMVIAQHGVPVWVPRS